MTHPIYHADLLYTLDPIQWAHDILRFEADPWQALALRSSHPRQIWCCGRQTGKSTTSALKALHTALFFPDSLTLIVSPSLRQSGELFRKITDFLSLVDTPMREETKLSLEVGNGSRIVSIPANESTLRGFSKVSLLILDEASKIPDEVYLALTPMLAVSQGNVLCMSTPFGYRGWFSDVWHNESREWERMMVKASECPRIPIKFLERERRTMGQYWYEQEFECAFLSSEDGVFDFNEVLKSIDDSLEPLFPIRGNEGYA
jgi:hypothetical protein